jgi:glutathione synthase/RimK-type ligase-like ATP-grasp enzyme
MRKLKYLFKRICGMNYKGFFNTIKDVHKKTGKNSIIIFFDIIYCGFKYQAGYIDYNLFEMYNMNKYERKTVITRGINNEIITKYNDPEYMKIFNDKIKFNKKFNKYLKRDWLEITENNLEEFKKFCKKHPKFIAKPTKESCGKGVEIIDSTNKDINKIHNELFITKRYLVEELATQCKEINDLHPDSINTLRVVTLKGIVVTALLRIGNNHNHVDNFNHEGLCVPIDVEDGIIKYKAIDKKGNLYEKHPITNKEIVGFKVPKWEEVKKLCEQAALEIPQVGYIGWDVCVTKDDICFIEANEFPGHDLYGLPPHRTNNIGLLPKFKEAMKKEIK